MNMKILRLSLFNLKKNKREAFSVMLLTAITMLLMGIAVCNITKVNTVFDEMFEATGSVENMILFPAQKYREEYKDILEKDDRVSYIEEIDALYSLRGSFKKNGAVMALPVMCVTEEEEKKLENFMPETNMTKEEIANLDHPIWLPTYFKYSQNYEVGNEFILVLGGRDYPFVIAGFYETGLVGNVGNGVKYIVSETDYQLLSAVMDEKIAVVYNCKDSLLAMEYVDRCAELSSENIKANCVMFDRESEKTNVTMFITLYLSFLIAIAFITMISCLFMIRHKISNDIEDQMESIGVLEALGYKSKEITWAYIYEYVFTGGIGAVVGMVFMFCVDPFLDSIIEGIMGHRVYGGVDFCKLLAILFVLIVIIVLSALGKAKKVKKFPPVVAFRKGIYNHHFGKNYLPLTGAKGNINFRLSMKELLGNTRGAIGMAICIVATAIAVFSGTYMFEYLSGGLEPIFQITGMETGDVRLVLMNGKDPYEIREEMLEMPEVRKALVSYPDTMLNTKGKITNNYLFDGYAVVFDDFEETEMIHLTEGRYPEHDNEIMITLGRSTREGYAIGDNIVIEGEGIDNSYIISGIVNSMSNGGMNLYFTSEGFRRTFPYARASVLEIYLEEGMDRSAFIEKLTALYGSSLEDTIEDKDAAQDYVDRIKQVADQKMAQLISLYGVTDMDYAIKIGDTVITGNSEKFIIRDINSMLDYAGSQLAPVADGMKALSLVIFCVSIIVAVVILSMFARTTVRRKRKELGIMKAMGYTSKDLMQQIAFQIMPVVFVAVIIAAVSSMYLMKAFGIAMFSAILNVNYGLAVPIGIGLLLFCYLVTYISAGKIKEISVTELMAE